MTEWDTDSDANRYITKSMTHGELQSRSEHLLTLPLGDTSDTLS